MRFNPLPPPMSTLVSRKPSTIGLRTRAAGARTDWNWGSSLALKVIAVSFHGFTFATWQISAKLRCARLRLLFEVKVSKTVSTVLCSLAGCGSVLWLSRRSSPLLATCRSIQHKAIGRCSVRRAVKLTRPVEPSFQYGPTPWGGLWFLGN